MFQIQSTFYKQIPYLYCLNIATLVDVVASPSFLHLLLLQHVIGYLEKIIQVMQNKEVLVPI